jgi:hypothetical protein
MDHFNASLETLSVNLENDNATDEFIKELNVCLVNFWRGANINQLEFLIDVFSIMGYSLKETQNNIECDIAIDSVFGKKEIVNKNAFKIFFTGEARTKQITDYDLALGFDYSSNENYLRFPLYYLFFNNKIHHQYERGECNANKEYFACFLVSNGGFKPRNEVFHEISSYKEVKSGGKYLNNMGGPIPADQTSNFLSKCKFVIAYENNIKYPGYITEKPFQAYFAGSIPIYMSEPRAAEDINKEAVIYRGDFNSNAEMIDYIKELDQNDNKYCDKYNKKIILDPSRNYENMKNLLLQKIYKKVKQKFS